MQTYKILAVGAHPDDIEFGMGGLMIKEIEKGSEVLYLVCSLGEAGTNGTPEGRKSEAENAAKFVNAKIEFIDLGGDAHIENKPENAIKIAEVIRKFKPEIVLAPSLSHNQHPDHAAVAELTRAATRLARYGGLEEIKALPVHKITSLYFYPSSSEIDKKPDIIVDVSTQYEKWMKAMTLHESQMKTRRYVDLVSSKAHALGASIGVEHAIGLWTNNPVRVEHISDLGLSTRNY